MIILKSVTKEYGGQQGYRALRGVDLELKANEMTGLIGHSGSGKSTLLNIIAGIDVPSSGRVLVNGKDITDLTENQKSLFRARNIGLVFQFYQLIPTLTILENVMIAMEFSTAIPERHRSDHALKLLESMGIEDHADKFPGEMSGGEQQRAALARALVNDPPIILADEPTGNLDSETAESIIGIFNKLAEGGKTILIVTHQPDLGFHFKRTIRLKDGAVTHDRYGDKG